MIDATYRKDFFLAALEAALWADLWTDEGDESTTTDNYESVEVTTLSDLRQECDDFIDANSDLLTQYAALTFGADQAGHDFHLTRNGHGAGYWDRGAGAVGDLLSDSARIWGDYSLWVDDEGVVRAQ